MTLDVGSSHASTKRICSLRCAASGSCRGLDATRQVLKARMVDGKLLWVREQPQKENP